MTRGAALLSLLLVPTAFAHDFWIEASDFRPLPGQTVTLRLFNGEALRGKPVPRIPSHIVRFVARTGGEMRPVEGAAGADPAGAVLFDGSSMVIGYESRTRSVDLQPRAFARYLDEEGLRNRVRPGAQAVRDSYSRCAKALIGEDAWPEPLGLELEIVPVTSPFASRTVTFAVTFRGKPLQDTLLVAMREGAKAEGRTGADGRVTLELAGAGTWLVKTVHIDCARATECRSWWASLAFGRVQSPR